MIIYPAIDLKDGKCVRLKKGNFDEMTVFNDEPYKVAMEFEAAGASFIHVVDLDGARLGSGYNHDAIEKILRHVSIPVQVGGGIRCFSDVAEKIQLGVSRVILGTAAIKNPDLVRKSVLMFGDKVAVGIDAVDGLVAVEAWAEVSEVCAIELCKSMQSLGVKTIIYTDISKDGMMQGPNFETTEELTNIEGVNIIASGGVSSMGDLVKLDKLNVHGAIIGKALYAEAIKLDEAVNSFEKKIS